MALVESAYTEAPASTGAIEVQLCLNFRWDGPAILPAALGSSLLGPLARGAWPEWVYSAVSVVRLAAWLHERGAAVSPAELLALVVSQLQDLGDHSDQTLRRMGQEMSFLVRHLESDGTRSIADVDVQAVCDFIDGPVRAGAAWADPSLSTRHLRRSAARLFFTSGRRLGFCTVDPTADIELPPRSGLKARPLDDDEVYQCRQAARRSLFETRLPAAMALAEAGASTSEISAGRVRDVDLDNGRVWFHNGGRRRIERWGTLTEWGAGALSQRIDAIGSSAGAPLVYAGRAGAASGQASACAAIFDVLAIAGIGGEPDVHPSSIPAWAARRIFTETGRIEDAARTLGVRSLDTAAQVIGWDWS